MDKEWQFTEAQRRHLQSVVGSLVIVEKADAINKFKCINCGQLPIRHNVANCNHVFCSTCIKDLRNKNCPECKNVAITQVNRDPKIEQGFLNLKVECQNKKRGCLEIIPIFKIQEHETKCKFSTDALLQQSVDCGNKLNSEIQQILEDMHRSQLSIEELKGDVEKINSQLLSAFDMISKKLEGENSNTDGSFIEDEQEINPEGCQTYSSIERGDEQSIVFLWKINGIKKKLQNMKTATIRSSTFYDNEFDLRFKVRLAVVKNISNTDQPSLAIDIEWDPSSPSFEHARKFTMVDLNNRIRKKHVSIMDIPYKYIIENKDEKTQGGNKYNIAQVDMKKSTFLQYILAPIKLLENHDYYIRDDAIVIKICIIPLTLLYKSVASYNGTLLCHIKNFTTQKQYEIDGFSQCLFSQFFCCGKWGHGMQVKIYLNGNGRAKGKFISIYVVVIRKEHEHGWSNLNCTIEFTLLDRTSHIGSQNLCKNVTFNYSEHPIGQHGIHDFVLQSKAEEATYLKNDSLCFKISATPRM